MALTIQELLASDTISQAADKINFNFDQLLLNGGGPAGPGGPQGPPGPIGGRGVRGSQWFEDTNPQPGVPPTSFPFPIGTDLEPNDSYLQANGNVWEYVDAITGWVNTGIDLTGPQGPAAFQYWAETGNPPISGLEILYPTTFGGNTGPEIRTTYLGAVPLQVPAGPQYKISTNINTQTNITNTVLGLQVPADSVAAIRFIGADPNQDDIYTQDIQFTQSIQLFSGDLLRLVDVKIPANNTELIGHNFSSSHKSLSMQYGRGVTIQSGLSSDTMLSSDTSILLQIDTDGPGASPGRIILDNLAAGHTAYLNVGDDQSINTLLSLPVMTGHINLKAEEIYNYAENYIWNKVILGNIQNSVNDGGIFSEATTKIQEKVGTGIYEVISNDTKINAFQDISIDSGRYTTMENENLIIKNNQGGTNNYTWIRPGGNGNDPSITSHATVFISNINDTIPAGMYPENDSALGQRPTLTVSGANPSGISSSATIAVGQYAYNVDGWISKRGRGAIYAQNQIVISNDTELAGYYGLIASSRLYLDNAAGDSNGSYVANQMIISNNRKVVPGKTATEESSLNIFTDSTNNDGNNWGKSGFKAVDINFSEINNSVTGAISYTPIKRSLLNLQYSDAGTASWKSYSGRLYGVNVNFENLLLRNGDQNRIYAFKSKLEFNGNTQIGTRSFGLHLENVGASYSASSSSDYESYINTKSENSNWLQRGLQVGLRLGEEWQANEKCNAITNMNPVQQDAGTENIYLTLMPMARNSNSRAGNSSYSSESNSCVQSDIDPPTGGTDGIAPGLMFQGLQSQNGSRYNPAENSFGAQTNSSQDNPNRTLALIYSSSMTPSGPGGAKNARNSNFAIFPHAGLTAPTTDAEKKYQSETVATTFNGSGQVRMTTQLAIDQTTNAPFTGGGAYPLEYGGTPGGGDGQILAVQNLYATREDDRSYAMTVWNAQGYGLYVKSGNFNGSTTIARFASDGGPSIVYGNVSRLANGDVNFVNSSDRLLKTNIADIPVNLGLKAINKLCVKEFNWKSNPDLQRKSIGLIAQEVKDIFPELVSKTPEPKDEEGKRPESYYTLSYMGLISPLIKATQELSTKCDMLEKENKELTDRLKLIEEKLGL